MTRLADRIMKRLRAHGRGRWVCTPKDFLDLGSREAVDQALSRLVRTGRLRRAGRGLYDLPRTSAVLGPARAGRSRRSPRRARAARRHPDHARRRDGRPPPRTHQRGAGQARIRHRRRHAHFRDRRRNGPAPARGTPRHALGGPPGGPGGPGSSLARPRRCPRPPCRCGPQAPSSQTRSSTTSPGRRGTCPAGRCLSPTTSPTPGRQRHDGGSLRVLSRSS